MWGLKSGWVMVSFLRQESSRDLGGEGERAKCGGEKGAE